MRILLTVELYNPHKGGAEKVVEDIAVGLLKSGHDVTVATTRLSKRKKNELRGVSVESFNVGGSAATGFTGGWKERKRYQDFVLNGGFDVIFNYAAQSWPTDLTFPILKNLEAKKVLAPVGYSRLKSFVYKKYFNILPAYLARYDALIYHSPDYQDKAYGDFNGFADKSVVIENGALKNEFIDGDFINVREKLRIEAKYLLITVAHHNVNKGHRFVIRAFKKMKRDDATLLIVGERVTSRGARRLAHFFLDYLYCLFSSVTNKNIRLADGRDRHFVTSAYKGADLHLFGSKLECAPLVMYESFASKTPFITTDVGNVRENEDYLRIANTPGEMANVANNLLDNDGERSKLAESAFMLWEGNNAVEEIVDKYEDLFEKLNRERT